MYFLIYYVDGTMGICAQYDNSVSMESKKHRDRIKFDV
jgi:hypothetical protein